MSDKVEATVANIRVAIDKELRALKVAHHEVEGKTIKLTHKDWDIFTFIFNDGTYLIFEPEVHYEDIVMHFPVMSIPDAVKYGLLSEEKQQALKDAESTAKEARNKSEGVIELNNAIANLGLDAVKKLVNES
jgi:hypothetical protein